MAEDARKSRFKRQKISDDSDMDSAKNNPYLAHMHDGDESNGASGQANGSGSSIAGLTRHATTAKSAAKAEDG
ncbi:hypothetical protein KC334_g12664, partial [Hortaea werneckii]